MTAIPGLVQDLVRAYMRRRWADTPQLELVPVAGGHREGTVMNIEQVGGAGGASGSDGA